MTKLELEPRNYFSTANIFDLPTFFQYGVGSPGFGAWRELKSHQFANEWILSGECPHFPLMHHWRVMPLPSIGSSAGQRQKIEGQIAYWEGSEPVRRRYEELLNAPSCIAVFLEYFPHDLVQWIDAQLTKESATASLQLVEKQLGSINHFLEKNHFLHFDAHFKNILTDGRNIYFTDFGLAISSRFELTNVELAFFEQHRLYDFGMSSISLVHSLLTHLYGKDVWKQNVTSLIAKAKVDLPSELSHLLTNHAPAALVMADLFRKLRDHSKQTPFPDEELERALSAAASKKAVDN